MLLQDNHVTLLDHWLDHQVMHRIRIEGLTSFRRCNHRHRRVHGRRLIIESLQRFCHLIEINWLDLYAEAVMLTLKLCRINSRQALMEFLAYFVIVLFNQLG